MRQNERLFKIANRVGYEWAMLLGACNTEWHETVNLPQPLRVVHEHARTELVWLHARVLYDFLFKQGKGTLRATEFLEPKASREWRREKCWKPVTLCEQVHSNIDRSNQKLFHLLKGRLTDTVGLPKYTVVRNELTRAFSSLYTLMTVEKRDIFRKGIDTDGQNEHWDVAYQVLS
jgi:hypothetical protein